MFGQKKNRLRSKIRSGRSANRCGLLQVHCSGGGTGKGRDGIAPGEGESRDIELLHGSTSFYSSSPSRSSPRNVSYLSTGCKPCGVSRPSKAPCVTELDGRDTS